MCFGESDPCSTFFSVGASAFVLEEVNDKEVQAASHLCCLLCFILFFFFFSMID